MATTWGGGPPSRDHIADVLDALALLSPCNACGANVGQPCHRDCAFGPATREARWYGEGAAPHNEETSRP